MKVAIAVFPGSNCDRDTLHVLRNVVKTDADLLWHREPDLDRYDAVILPGGFSYGDYLRAGVIGAFSPILKQVREMAREGKPVLGICNGFQILVESGLLPGALMTNLSLKFVCKWAIVKVESSRTAFTGLFEEGALLNMPVAHQQGRFFIDEKELKRLVDNDQIVFSYSDAAGRKSEEANPNGSLANIAGICNREGNVVGLMPHPERASEPILSPFQSQDGLLIFRSMLNHLKNA
ncbi:MAG: phosphoribosylformylglycinamidine synthase I [Thaumarchaeota archaeon]|nr:phosphoribosylformylglycinamidine synthase I [Nitrososphaerota archaeon]